MSKRIKTHETLGDKIDETLAENVTDLFRNGMNEDQFGELTKDIQLIGHINVHIQSTFLVS
jgi:hypothetical protein